MSEQNQNSKQTNKTTTSSSNTNTTEASKLAGVSAVPTSGWKKLLSKKWVFPALYIAAAALIVTLVWVYQDQTQLTPNTDTQAVQSNNPVDSGKTDAAQEDAQEVVANSETLGWPVANVQDVEVLMGFFDEKASQEEQEKAMVLYNQSYTPNIGIDLARKDKQDFDVLAAMSGKVSRVESNPVTGEIVELDHGNGLKTVYESVAEVKVKKGDMISKGDIIAKAGRSEIKKDFGVHVHFQVFEDEKPVNPSSVLAKN